MFAWDAGAWLDAVCAVDLPFVATVLLVEHDENVPQTPAAANMMMKLLLN
jgi:hypothetical protein